MSGQAHSQALHVVGSVPRRESGLTSDLVNLPGRGRFKLGLQRSNASQSVRMGDATNTEPDVYVREKGHEPPASAPATQNGDFAITFIVT